MFPMVLIPLILAIIPAIIAFIIYITPLDLCVLASRRSGLVYLSLSACWSIFGLGYSYTQGGGRMHLLMSGKSIYSREISQAPRVASKMRRPETGARTLLSQICIIQALLPGILRILRAFPRYGRFQRLSCNLVFGTGKPAETGLIFGIFSAVRPILMLSPRVSLSLEPVFDQEILEGNCRIDLRLNRPLVVISLILRLVLSPGTLRILKKCRSGGSM
jgi:Protein of unknown function (DUF2953)